MAAQLRYHHNVEPGYSDVLARRLLHPYARCGICGLPNRIRACLVRTGRFLFLGNRMTVDHLDPLGPGTQANLRLLCRVCNSTRGAAVRTDEEVLRKVTRWWERRLQREALFWLNTRPGRGGNPLRGRRHSGSVLAYFARPNDGADGAPHVGPPL